MLPIPRQTFAHALGDSQDAKLGSKTLQFIRLGGLEATMEALSAIQKRMAAARRDTDRSEDASAARRDGHCRPRCGKPVIRLEGVCGEIRGRRVSDAS